SRPRAAGRPPQRARDRGTRAWASPFEMKSTVLLSKNYISAFGFQLRASSCQLLPASSFSNPAVYSTAFVAVANEMICGRLSGRPEEISMRVRDSVGPIVVVSACLWAIVSAHAQQTGAQS